MYVNLITISTLILALMFMLAAIKAFTDREAYMAMLGDFGVSARFRQALAVTLTGLELLTGVALLVPACASAGAMAALCLLCCYTAVLAYTLSTGKRPRCNCFGQLSQKPIGYRTILRNGGFIALSALLVWRDDVPMASSVGVAVSTTTALVGIVMAVQSWMVMHLLTQNGRLFLKIDTIEMQLKAAGFDNWVLDTTPIESKGLPIGTLAPECTVTSARDGSRRMLSELRSKDRPTVLIFSDTACGPCKELLPQIARWRQQHEHALKLVIIMTASDERGTESYKQLGDVTFIQNARDAAALYEASATPSAVVVSREGSIASTLAMGEHHIRDLVHAIAAAERSESISNLPGHMQPA